MLGQMPVRFQRTGMTQDIRSRMMQQGFQNHNLGQMPQATQNYIPQRVPFPIQSPTGMNINIAPLRSPSPLVGLSPTNTGNQVIMAQGGASPVNSPMRRPSGNGSAGSPLPKSVENPLTPRSSGSGPHTPFNSSCSVGHSHTMDPTHQSNESIHYNQEQMLEIPNNNLSSRNIQQQQFIPITPVYSQSASSQSQDGSGGGNSQLIPFPTFAWFKGPENLGLKGGNPFSVVTGNPSHHANVLSNNRTSVEQANIESIPVSAETTSGATTVQFTAESVALSNSADANSLDVAGMHGSAANSLHNVGSTSHSIANSLNNAGPTSHSTAKTQDTVEPTIQSTVKNLDSVGPTSNSKAQNMDNTGPTSLSTVDIAGMHSLQTIANSLDNVGPTTYSTTNHLDDVGPTFQSTSNNLENVGPIIHSTSNSLGNTGPTNFFTTDGLDNIGLSTQSAVNHEVGIVHSHKLGQVLPISKRSSPPAVEPCDKPVFQSNNTNEEADNGSGVSLGTQLLLASTQGGESQNALLKQLLQNTGCASMSQVQQENSGFSLSACLPGRTTNATSHLSEAATRIPQPTPMLRATETSSVTSPHPTPVVFKTEPPEVTENEISQPAKNSPVKLSSEETEQSITVEENVKAEFRKDTISSSLKECIENVATDKLSFDPSIFAQRRAEEDARKAKRRQYQAKRRQSTGKDSATQPKKRSRKGSKLEEDYDSYVETLMAQLRQLVPVGIVEPVLGQNYLVCSPPGVGDLTKFNNKDYSIHLGDIEGSLFCSSITNRSDYYTTRPFGEDQPQRYQNQQTSQRGFYNQEFALPRVLILGTKSSLDLKSPSPIRESDSPDTIVSSSSPECDTNENLDPYPGLRLIDEVTERKNCRSPIIPLGSILTRFASSNYEEIGDLDKENKNLEGPGAKVDKARLGFGIPFKENGNTLITLTLSSIAAIDVVGTLRNLANILSVSPLSVFQVEQTLPPPYNSLKLYAYKSKDGKETIDLQSILNGAAKFCRHCDVIVLNNIIKRKASDLSNFSPNEAVENIDEFSFCSSSCLMQFAMTHGIAMTSEKVGTVVNHPSTEPSKSSGKTDEPSRVKHDSEGSDNCSSQLLKSSPNAVNKLKRSASGEVSTEAEKQTPVKKWKNVKYKKWLQNCQPVLKYKKSTEKELTEMLFRLSVTVRMPSLDMPEDTRKCFFCHQFGDTVSDGPARLLNLDVDKWVHLNCALWSDEVYETESGALVNVELALKQSLTLICVACNQNGATVKCFKVRCCSVYHLGCAIKEGCIFYQNKTVYCSAHIPKGEKDNELTTLAVFRRVYIQRDENRQVAAVMHHADQHHLLRVGSLIFLSVGQLLPHQLQAFHSPNYIYPIGYKIVRFYWSMTRINKRCQYICSIHEVDGKPEFRITTLEDSCKECVLKGDSASIVWSQVLDAIAKLRISSGCIKLFPKFITGEDLFGLTEPTIVKVLESLPGVETLVDYHFKYGRNPLLELPLAINPTGCARSEPKLRTHFKRPHTQRTGSFRATCTPTSIISSSEAACPYSKQFVHSKSSQYKKMKQDWRNNVYLARSKIQGLGLYAARDIEKHTMVIEYIGEIIRSELAETREKKYEAQNRGIYMFRVDEDRVIDATLCGGLARYINHSCNPNCVAETVEVDRDHRIIIFANRRISRGEELAYDYKFEFEDDGHKIPCSCGAPNCRQWMN